MKRIDEFVENQLDRRTPLSHWGQMAHLAYGRMALQKVTDMTNVDLATLRTFDLSPYVTPRAVVTSASHLSVDLAHTRTLGP